MRGEYAESLRLVSFLPSLFNWELFRGFSKKTFPFFTFQLRISFKIGVLSGFCPFTYSEWGRQNERPFLEKIFSAENKKAEKPTIYGHFRLKKFFEIFLI